MIRRRYLGVVAAGTISVFSGCSSGGDSGDDQDPQNDSTMNDSTSGPTQQRDVDVVLDSAEWREDEEAIELFVDNNGGDRSGTISLTVNWYDAEGNFLGYESFGVRTLGGDETWWFWFEPSIEWHPVDGFELFLDYSDRGLSTPQDVAIQESDFGDDLLAEGIVENNQTQQSALEMIVPIYGENGRMLFAYSTSQDRIPANTNWRFQMPIQGYEPDVIADHEFLLHSLGG
jgi:hypothetical protein